MEIKRFSSDSSIIDSHIDLNYYIIKLQNWLLAKPPNIVEIIVYLLSKSFMSYMMILTYRVLYLTWWDHEHCKLLINK